MNEEQKEWQKQFSSNFGAREYVRFAIAFVACIFAGVALAILLRSVVAFYIFLFVAFAFPLLGSRWKPTYSIFRWILGNKNIPLEPMPHRPLGLPVQKRPWWSYLPGIWWLLIVLVLLFLVIRYFSR